MWRDGKQMFSPLVPLRPLSMQRCLEGPREGSPRRWCERGGVSGRAVEARSLGWESPLCRLILVWGVGYGPCSNPGEMWQL